MDEQAADRVRPFDRLSQVQQNGLSYTWAGSAVISLLGTALLLRMLYQKYIKRGGSLSATNRMILAISLADILPSTRNISSFISNPNEPGTVCTVQGVTLVLGLMGSAYYMWLCVLYRIIVQEKLSNVSKSCFALWEPIAHVSTISIFIMLVGLSLSYEVFNPSSSIPGCAVSASPTLAIPMRRTIWNAYGEKTTASFGCLGSFPFSSQSSPYKPSIYSLSPAP